MTTSSEPRPLRLTAAIMEELTTEALTVEQMSARMGTQAPLLEKALTGLTQSRHGRPVADFGIQLPPYGKGRYGTAYVLTGHGWTNF